MDPTTAHAPTESDPAPASRAVELGGVERDPPTGSLPLMPRISLIATSSRNR